MTRFRDIAVIGLVVLALGLAGGIAVAQTLTTPLETTGIPISGESQRFILSSTDPVTPTQPVEATPTRTQPASGFGSVPNPCEITLLDPEVIEDEEGNPQIRFSWELDRPLAADEYYLLFLGGFIDEEPYMMGSFWDPVLEDRGPWSLEVLETMGPLLALTELKETVYDMPFMETDDGILRWEIQVRATGSEYRAASAFDRFMCKRDAALLSVTSTDEISPTLSLEVVPTPTLMPTPTLPAEELLLQVTPEAEK